MKLLATDKFELSADDLARLAEAGVEVTRCSDESYEGDPSAFEAVACRFLFSYVPIERFTSLKYIQISMAGFDHMPMDYIRSHGIEFHNARDVYSGPIAEFAIGEILSLYKRFRDFDREQRAHQWNLRRNLLELWDKRVLIVGAGSIGAAFAQRLRPFGCHVTGLARTAGTREHFDEVLAMAELDGCLPGADIVILCLPSNRETYHIMDSGRFARMKDGAVLVNICRGAVVDERAITEALESGRLGGAVLDVFETEPLPEDSPLWDMPNVIVTPHSSFGAEHNLRRLTEVLYRNLLASPLLANKR